MLLRQSCLLLRRCGWCGLGFSLYQASSRNPRNALCQLKCCPTVVRIKPGPHQQQCRSNVRLCRNNEILTQNSFDIVAVLATKSNVASTLLLVWTGLNANRSRVSVMSTFCHCHFLFGYLHRLIGALLHWDQLSRHQAWIIGNCI